MNSANTGLAIVLAASFALAANAGRAEPSDVTALSEKPQDFLDETIEMKAYCLKGGRDGDVLGYECTTKAGVYVQAADIEPEDAKTKLDGDCASAKCETTVEFVPHSYTSSGVIEPDKTVIIYNTKKAKVRF